ncbi:hypothetical protein [Streptomyces werraensis]|uniref:hypothetical protein n=1 Tax=Streptomyces werraensis TaxID=68284 RepID=UPI00368F377B
MITAIYPIPSEAGKLTVGRLNLADLSPVAEFAAAWHGPYGTSCLTGRDDGNMNAQNLNHLERTEMPDIQRLLQGRATRPLATSLLLGALTASITLLPQASAHAASSCSSYQQKEFPTSGYNTDVSIAACIEREQGTNLRRAVLTGRWADGGGVRKFDEFTLIVRLERNDNTIDSQGCTFTARINANEQGVLRCETAWHSGTSGGWSSDGVVAYDIDADGQGVFGWSLHGSPTI